MYLPFLPPWEGGDGGGVVWDTTLNNNTTYYYRVAGWRNGELLDTTGTDYEGFSTPSATSTTPPDITEVVAASSGQGMVEITWKTTAPTTTQVQYGPTTGYGSWSPLDSNLLDAHTVTLGGLSVGTYHFRVKCTRSGRSDAYSLDYTVRVPQHYQSVLAVKALADGNSVGFSGTVSAIFGDCFYVVDQSRLSGIRVDAIPAGIVEGQTVYVSGTLTTHASGSRCISGASYAVVE